MPDEQFIPPDPNEPIPQPPPGGGATDKDAGGVLVIDVAEIDAAIDRLAAAFASVAVGSTSAPAWNQVYKLAKSQLAKYAPGRVRENVNDYTQWYYGNNTAAAFCFIYISWCLAHAISRSPSVAQQNAGLQLIGGKKAYVPYIRNVPGYRAGHSGMKVGAIVAVSGFNHIGFCVGVGSSTFQLLSGNSVNGSSDDAITIKTYSLTSASGYVNLKYSSTPQEDDMQPTDKLPVGDWMKTHWKTDKGITDGTMLVETTLTSGYGHSRAAHENTDELVKMVTDLQKVVTTLAAAVADMDARLKAS